MAKLSKSYQNGIEKITINFRGKDFTLTSSRWDGENGDFVSKEKCFDIQIEKAYEDDDDVEEIAEIVDNLSWEDDTIEILDRLEELEQFE